MLPSTIGGVVRGFDKEALAAARSDHGVFGGGSVGVGGGLGERGGGGGGGGVGDSGASVASLDLDARRMARFTLFALAAASTRISVCGE